MTRTLLLGSIVLGGMLVVASELVLKQRPSSSPKTQNTESTPEAQTASIPTPTLSPSSNNQAPIYRLSLSMRSRVERILWVYTEPENFTREKMMMLARQLNKDFPDEPRLYAVIFDSEKDARAYDPVGGTYDTSKELERGEYFLNRINGQESINFSTQHGRPVNEIKVRLGNRTLPAEKRKRVSP